MVTLLLLPLSFPRPSPSPSFSPHPCTILLYALHPSPPSLSPLTLPPPSHSIPIPPSCPLHSLYPSLPLTPPSLPLSLPSQSCIPVRNSAGDMVVQPSEDDLTCVAITCNILQFPPGGSVEIELTSFTDERFFAVRKLFCRILVL